MQEKEIKRLLNLLAKKELSITDVIDALLSLHKKQNISMMKGFLEMIETNNLQSKTQMIDLINAEINYINGKTR